MGGGVDGERGVMLWTGPTRGERLGDAAGEVDIKPLGLCFRAFDSTLFGDG